MSNSFSDRYIETALWTEYAEVGDRLLAAEARRRMVADCDRFRRANGALLRRAAALGEDDVQAGHDFWLSRNRRGSGFLDRGLGKVGDALHAAAKAWGECDLYIGDEVHVA